MANRHFFFADLLAGLPAAQTTLPANMQRLALERMQAMTATFKRDKFVLNCEAFLNRVCILLSGDWRCWRRSLALKGYVHDKMGWDLEGEEFAVTSVARVQTSGDLLGFYTRLNAVLSRHPIHPNFQSGEYDYEWDPVKHFGLNRFNLCNNQQYPWLTRGPDQDDVPPRMGYDGMGRRTVQPGKILTSKWTMIEQRNKVAFIEMNGDGGEDREIEECTKAAFHTKFEGSDMDGEGYYWVKF